MSQSNRPWYIHVARFFAVTFALSALVAAMVYAHYQYNIRKPTKKKILQAGQSVSSKAKTTAKTQKALKTKTSKTKSASKQHKKVKAREKAKHDQESLLKGKGLGKGLGKKPPLRIRDVFMHSTKSGVMRWRPRPRGKKVKKQPKRRIFIHSTKSGLMMWPRKPKDKKAKKRQGSKQQRPPVFMPTTKSDSSLGVFRGLALPKKKQNKPNKKQNKSNKNKK